MKGVKIVNAWVVSHHTTQFQWHMSVGRKYPVYSYLNDLQTKHVPLYYMKKRLICL